MSKVLPHRSETTTTQCKHSRELSLGLRSSKGMDKGLRSAMFKGSNHMYRLKFLRENLIGGDNRAIT